MKNLVRKINPPGYEKTNRRKLFDIIDRLGQTAADDATHVLRNFFPFLSDSSALEKHGEALMIPRYSSDSDETYRARVAAAAFYMFQRGTRGFLKAELLKRFSSREVDIIETYMHLTVKVLDMTESDRAWLKEFLGKELDPNILVGLVDLYRWVEKITSSDSMSVSSTMRHLEKFSAGICYDGSARYDRSWTGTALVDAIHNGVAIANGSQRYDGYLRCEAEKRPEPATYSGESDALGLGLGMGMDDTAAFVPCFDGMSAYDGAVRFAEMSGIMGIEMMTIDIRRN